MASRMIDEKSAAIFIYCAIGAALVSAAFTAFAIATGVYGFNAWNLIDAGILLALSFGLLRKSRTCAILLFVLHLVNRYDMYTRTRDWEIALGPPAMVWALVYVLGIIGTFSTHAIQKDKAAGPGGPTAAG